MTKRYCAISAYSLVIILSLTTPIVAEDGSRGQQVPHSPYKLKKIENIRYYNGKDADNIRHRLDLYLPEGKKDFPVIMWVHGGGWQIGYKNQLGMPARMGKTMAGKGIGFVSINYRLSPKVQHPGHIRDVARAFAWIHKNIGKYGGRADEIFISGHSAGGHLVALLATNDRYLKNYGMSLRHIRGALPISGIFRIGDKKFFTTVFGDDSAGRRTASPIYNARKDGPPFLILYADKDFPNCDRPAAQAFYKAMKKKGAAARIIEIAKRNHLTIWWNANKETDPVFQAMYTFVVAHTALHRLGTDGPAGFDVLREFLLK